MLLSNQFLLYERKREKKCSIVIVWVKMKVFCGEIVLRENNTCILREFGEILSHFAEHMIINLRMLT